MRPPAFLSAGVAYFTWLQSMKLPQTLRTARASSSVKVWMPLMSATSTVTPTLRMDSSGAPQKISCFLKCGCGSAAMISTTRAEVLLNCSRHRALTASMARRMVSALAKRPLTSLARTQPRKKLISASMS
eukprot:328306-Lingulodinium_polyedra.AAC.1